MALTITVPIRAVVVVLAIAVLSHVDRTYCGMTKQCYELWGTHNNYEVGNAPVLRVSFVRLRQTHTKFSQ